MTKQHFEDFARRIKADRDSARQAVVDNVPGASDAAINVYDETLYAAALISFVSATYNPRFDQTRFFRACGIAS